jgi:hypothetical protein
VFLFLFASLTLAWGNVASLVIVFFTWLRSPWGSYFAALVFGFLSAAALVFGFLLLLPWG